MFDNIKIPLRVSAAGRRDHRAVLDLRAEIEGQAVFEARDAKVSAVEVSSEPLRR